MVEKKQDKSLELLKSVFKDNDDLIKSIRGLWLGFEISAIEKKKIKELFKNPELKKIVKQKLFAELTNETDVGIIPDFWSGIETQIQGKNIEEINQVVMSKQNTLEMLEGAIALLDDPDDGKIDLRYNPKSVKNDPYQIGLLSRALYIKTINTGTSWIKILANAKEETQEEVAQRIRKDSAK